MNIAKNMEAIFFAAIALVSVTGFATAQADALHGRAASVSAVPEGKMQVVTISAKRLSAAEKAAAAQ